MPHRYTFPKWVTSCRDPEAQKTARLRYILYRALLERYGKINIHEFSKSIGFDHSSVFCALARGSMSYEMATAVEKQVGKDLVSVQNLMDPSIV